MQAILKHLEDGLNELGKRLAELAKDKKEYEAKFKDLSEIEIKLREKGKEINDREAKVKYIENVAEYSDAVAADAKRVREERTELDPKIKKHEQAVREFNDYKNAQLKSIENATIANQKQAEALIAERNEFDAKIRAYKAIKNVV